MGRAPARQDDGRLVLGLPDVVTGIKTPQAEIDLVRERLNRLEAWR
jgi:hypothetical protein